ncbi:MAG TPA: hypothetical protein VHS05_04610 [Pyrinomonadaceae bacterium]|jgi:hypothetical protein|nr:hypothetical protein [Pyrinomonadaceae bacterium]
MPKDPTKNIDRYKIRGGDINEFEYEQKQEAFAEQKNKAAANLIPGTPPEERAQRFPPAFASKATKTTTKKAATKKATKATKATKKAAVPTRGASAKKLAARKAAKKK